MFTYREKKRYGGRNKRINTLKIISAFAALTGNNGNEQIFGMATKCAFQAFMSIKK